jgi:FkbM family methyltransferase
LTIRYKGLTLNFSTQSPIAKRWFYPRYISGERVHEPPIAALIRSELGPGSTFFDVGANLGFFTVLAANICTASDSSVHAFELDPALIPLIQESLRLNEQCGRVFLNCVACVGESGHFHTYRAVQEDNPSTNQIVSAGKEAPRTSAQAMTVSLDHYSKRTGVTPDLVKMDIEGAEALAVPGMLNLVEEARPKVILEVHPDDVRHFDGTPAALVQKLRQAGGYENVFHVASHRRTVQHRDQILTPLDMSAFEGDNPVVVFFDHEKPD